jgi:hypothetical protein
MKSDHWASYNTRKLSVRTSTVVATNLTIGPTWVAKLMMLSQELTTPINSGCNYNLGSATQSAHCFTNTVAPCLSPCSFGPLYISPLLCAGYVYGYSFGYGYVNAYGYVSPVPSRLVPPPGLYIRPLMGPSNQHRTVSLQPDKLRVVVWEISARETVLFCTR